MDLGDDRSCGANGTGSSMKSWRQLARASAAPLIGAMRPPPICRSTSRPRHADGNSDELRRRLKFFLCGSAPLIGPGPVAETESWCGFPAIMALQGRNLVCPNIHARTPNSETFSTLGLQGQRFSAKVLDSLLRNESVRSDAARPSGVARSGKFFKNQQPISVGVLVRECVEYRGVIVAKR
jgi:hypothetical protein